MNNKPNRLAYLAAVLYASIIGCSYLFVKLALESAQPVDLLAHRFTISFAAASIPVLFGWIRLNIKLKEVVAILPLVAIYPVLFFTFQTYGLVDTSSSEAGIIQATVPMITLVMAMYWLKERPSLRQKLSTLLSVAGVAYLFISKGIHWQSVGFQGNLLILASAISLAGYGVLARKLLRNISAVSITYTMTVIGFVFFNSMNIVRHAGNGSLGHYFDPFMNLWFVGAILYLGVMASLVSSFLSNYTLSKMEASKMSVFNNVSTLVTVTTGIIFLQEQLTQDTIIGGAAIIAGVIGANWRRAAKHTAATKVSI
ncbi:Permease of the drug/metabolite transporter (DMT) superfamily [Paenibacillus sp. 1_12]|uniref:DMT family transporter n=1 Tax=Paenibacillus sp. 1_12 TaxID=1566278 RepID=UPI0008E80125|nr:DMT family transporter [Paenibacillus sp. 1_12]SFM06584.1 Permease of the drug/metabolite transporter (DMT) superfamily [Paenibacillus sp. 1_12]